MWFKIYFWVLIFLSVLAVMQDFGKVTYFYFIDWVDLVIAIISFIGLYAYVFKKNIFTLAFWKIFFWIFTISYLFEFIYTFTPLEEAFPLPALFKSAFTRDMVEQQGVTLEQALMFGIIITIPQFYALFKLAYSKKKK